MSPSGGWPVRWVVLVAVLVGAALVGVLAQSANDETATARTTDAAIGAWLVDHRDEVFPTYDGEYVGRCADMASARDGLCSIPRDDLGARQIHGVGVYGTNWGAELLLERAGGGWSVIDNWPWSEPGAAPPEYGPPWSPHTAIAEWWAGHGARRYPGEPPVAYVHDCVTSGADPSVTQQTLVCSTLVSATDERRVYRTGRLPTGDDVVLALHHRSDHSWAVSELGG